MGERPQGGGRLADCRLLKAAKMAAAAAMPQTAAATAARGVRLQQPPCICSCSLHPTHPHPRTPTHTHTHTNSRRGGNVHNAGRPIGRAAHKGNRMCGSGGGQRVHRSLCLSHLSATVHSPTGRPPRHASTSCPPPPPAHLQLGTPPNACGNTCTAGKPQAVCAVPVCPRVSTCTSPPSGRVPTSAAAAACW